MNTHILDLPSVPAATGAEANTVKVTPISNGVTDEMIAELQRYCINNFNGSGNDVNQDILKWLQSPKNKEYAARHPNPKALFRLMAKRRYLKKYLPKKNHISMEALSNKDLRQMAEKNNDEKENDNERLEQVCKIASAPLRKAIKYILAGDTFTIAAQKIGVTVSQLSTMLGRLGGRNSIQPELLWEKAS